MFPAIFLPVAHSISYKCLGGLSVICAHNIRMTPQKRCLSFTRPISLLRQSYQASNDTLSEAPPLQSGRLSPCGRSAGRLTNSFCFVLLQIAAACDTIFLHMIRHYWPFFLVSASLGAINRPVTAVATSQAQVSAT